MESSRVHIDELLGSGVPSLRSQLDLTHLPPPPIPGGPIYPFVILPWQLLQQSLAPAQILDLREPDRFARGHLSGAINMPYGRFQDEALDLLDPARPVLVVDPGGARAAEMATWLRARGVSAGYLEGGYAAWTGPLVRTEVPTPALPPFGEPFDAAMAEAGPPAIFTVDAEGTLRLDTDRTRDAWARLGRAPTPGFCPCLFRDRATGWVQLVLATSPELVAEHPRADIAVYDSGADAVAALARLPDPPVWGGAWPP